MLWSYCCFVCYILRLAFLVDSNIVTFFCLTLHLNLSLFLSFHSLHSFFVHCPLLFFLYRAFLRSFLPTICLITEKVIFRRHKLHKIRRITSISAVVFLLAYFKCAITRIKCWCLVWLRIGVWIEWMRNAIVNGLMQFTWANGIRPLLPSCAYMHFLLTIQRYSHRES